MRIAIFLCLLLMVVAVFVQAQSVKKKFKKTKTGKCEEHKPSDSKNRSRPRLYLDKECTKDLKKSESDVKRSVKQVKSRQQSYKIKVVTTNSTHVKSSDKKRLQRDTAATILKKAQPKRARQITRKPATAKPLINKPSTSRRKKAVALIKRSQTDSKRALAKTNPEEKSSKASQNKNEVSRRKKNHKKRQTKSTAYQQPDAEWPVATEEESGCYIKFPKETKRVKNGCQAIRKPHFFLNQSSGECVKVMKDEVDTKKPVDLSNCDRQGKYPRYVLQNNKCVFKLLNLPSTRNTFKKKTDCRPTKINAKMTKSRKRKRNNVEVLLDGDNVEVLLDEDENEEEDYEEEEYEEEEYEEEEDEDNAEVVDDEEVQLAFPETTNVRSLPTICRLEHGTYKGQCLDMTTFFQRVSTMPLDNPSNYNLIKLYELGNHIYKTQAKANNFNLAGLRNAALRYMAVFPEGPGALIAATADAAFMEYCELVDKYNAAADHIIKGSLTDCE